MSNKDISYLMYIPEFETPTAEGRFIWPAALRDVRVSEDGKMILSNDAPRGAPQTKPKRRKRS
jgi:hypothetical protein